VHLNLRSKCKFIALEKKFAFDIVSIGMVKSGSVPIQDIDKLVEEETRDDGQIQKRFAVEYGKKTVPLYLGWKSKEEHEKLGELINDWLVQHSFPGLVHHESA
jgi:hypothetical protein